jgi:hypothetical protein
MLERIEIKDFTAFHALDLRFRPGINVLLGPNATGKTHLLKILYAVTAAHRLGDSIEQKLLRVFLPEPMRLGRLVRRARGGQSASVTIHRDGEALSFRFSSNQGKDQFAEMADAWAAPAPDDAHPIFIPPKDMLAHAPGFRSLYDLKEVHFDETYRDILVRALVPVTRGAPSPERRELKAQLERLVHGRIVEENERFSLEGDEGKLEFSLLAEGVRKFALLLRLVDNDTLRRSSFLFWDEPEANINPAAVRDLVGLLLHLARETGVQIFLATHSDFVLSELDAQQRAEEVRFFALYREDGEVVAEVKERADALTHNPIDAETLRLYDEEIARTLGGRR